MLPDAKAAAEEFDRWADAGRAESMAQGHLGVTSPVINSWNLDSSSTVLDVGCGNGWAVQALVSQGAGQGFGVDIAPKMVALANQSVEGDDRYNFQVSSASELPYSDGTVTHLLNVESLYYYPDPAAALQEWARVTKPGGKLAIVVDLYEENKATHSWIDALDVHVHLLSAADICAMAEKAGWKDVRWHQVIDPRPIKSEAEFTVSKYWPSYDMYLDYRQTGALVVEATR
ncbi:MAG: class I SAM-dependent methyltransferase [Myxococcota bacterium]